MSNPDALFSLRNNFHLGAYQAAVNESSLGGLSEAETIERDTLVYRAYIALGSYQLVIDEISDSSPTALQAVKLLAKYLADPSSNDQILQTITDLMQDSAVGKNPTLLLIAGTIHAHEKSYEEALKITNSGASGNLDLMALNVQLYLKMDRVDFAEKQLKAMLALDEDATLSQLANAWVNLAQGGSKVQEASLIFQELCEKFSWTVPVMNGSAVCQMFMGRYDEAESLLLEALNKDAKDANTLANLVVCALHRGKPASRHMNQLRNVAPDHSLLKCYSNSESAFDQAAAAYA